MRWYVMSDNGFGDWEHISSHDTFEEANEALEKVDGGPENETLPDWAEYQDDVGYGGVTILDEEQVTKLIKEGCVKNPPPLDKG